MLRATPGWAWAWTGLVLITAALPCVFGLLAAPDGATYSGVVINEMDTNSYLANMRLGMAGRWLYRLPYTAPPSEPVPLFMVYILLGQVAGLLNLAPALVFHAARLLSGGLFAVTACHFIARCLASRAERKLALGLLLFTGGIGWLVVIVAGSDLTGDRREIPDLWSSDAISFLALLSNPHFTLNMTLMMALLALGERFIRRGDRRAGAGAALAGVGIAFVHAHQIAVTGAALAGIVALGVWDGRRAGSGRSWREAVRAQAPQIGRLAVVMGPGVVTAALLTLSTRSDPYLRSWLAQGDTYTPPPWSLLILYGPVGLLALAGLWWTVRAGDDAAERRDRLVLAALWFVVVAALIYVPVNFQRRFMEGWHVPVTILAAAGWQRAVRPRIAPRLRGIALRVLVASVALSPLFILAATLTVVTRDDDPFVTITSGERAALDRLDALAGPDDVVLAAFETGNRLPARVGVRSVVATGR